MAIQQISFKLPEYKRGFHLITNEVINQLSNLPQTGILHLFIQHTSAGLCINENADPTLRTDLEYVFNKLAPENDPNYLHIYEGADDMPAHIKSIITGNQISIPITNGKLKLGTWQGIYLCEFRNSGGNRKMVATVIS
tara:strand:+ start:521 stop:934 length:414 start_codon:yes stop_codon:yes gene_type:complete